MKNHTNSTDLKEVLKRLKAAYDKDYDTFKLTDAATHIDNAISDLEDFIKVMEEREDGQ